MSGAVSVRRFSLPLAEPLATAQGTISERKGIAIAFRTGREMGIGEATPLPGWTEELDDTERAIRSMSINGPSHHWARRLAIDRPAARHAVQLAVADLAARRAGLPLAQYLRGDDVPAAIPVNATVGDGPIDDTVDRVAEAIDRGFKAVKVKIGGQPVSDTIVRIESMADLTARTELRLDANRAFDFTAAQEVITAAADAGYRAVEEPLAEPTPDRLATLERDSLEIMVDETVTRLTTDANDQWWDAVDAIVLKPMVLGGLDRAVDLAVIARSKGVGCIVSNTIDAVVARSGAVHLAAALKSERPAGLATGGMLSRDLATNIVPVADGKIAVPTSPGIGTRGPWDRTATAGSEPC